MGTVKGSTIHLFANQSDCAILFNLIDEGGVPLLTYQWCVIKRYNGRGGIIKGKNL